MTLPHLDTNYCRDNTSLDERINFTTFKQAINKDLSTISHK